MSAVSPRLPDVIIANCRTVEALRVLDPRYPMISRLVLNEFSKTAAASTDRVFEHMYNRAEPTVQIAAVQAVYDRHFAHLHTGVALTRNRNLIGGAHVLVGSGHGGDGARLPVAMGHAAAGASLARAAGHGTTLPSLYGSAAGARGRLTMPGGGR